MHDRASRSIFELHEEAALAQLRVVDQAGERQDGGVGNAAELGVLNFAVIFSKGVLPPALD